jgi:hypothetical protein
VNKVTKSAAFFEKFRLWVRVKQFFKDAIGQPLYLMSHPIQGFEDFRREKTAKNSVAWFYLWMMVLASIISFNANGFLVNKNNPRDFDLFMTIALVVFPVFIVVVANWATTALMDGKGTMADIFRLINYSFFPYVWLSLLATLISNFITADELMFFTIIQGAGVILTAYMMFFGFLGVHEFGQFKTILMILFTIVAIAVILFIILLFFSLTSQVWSFIKSVYEEFVLRFL